ncbi:MAG: hypothetical protein KC516_01225 [Nanoarchaeota archaeon]|nr:hypothetical protein [Nanoarchaeota archaeon]
MEKVDYINKEFIGSSYYLVGEDNSTVEKFKKNLLKIIDDLPENGTLKITQIEVHDGKIEYTLAEGINQDCESIKSSLNTKP